ncbi:hypothetical protein LCGC14_1849820 [marine sediment metagenome]|uniref:Uncharacterized protein n=1 Tax=marine sediment metagenome TaxID=412755 RepID=A0A0F9GAM1_9ZZZZ
MGHFRGTLRGNRGGASRLGTKGSGLDVTAASWEGAVSVSLWHNGETGVDMAEVRLALHCGAGARKLLYHGPVSGKEEVAP